MVEQRIPSVTVEDVKRIVFRDFGESKSADALSILKDYNGQDGPRPRVCLAILKLANGDLDRLREVTKAALADYRDVLAWAEYPRWIKEVGFNDRAGFKQAVIDDDWKQYCQWLNRI